ncbi:MAG: hypothetical protein ACLQPD_14360 [Desulfomonilaceae bacterium]
MSERKRFDIKGILADPDLRRKLMVPTIQATQAREGIETTEEQARRAYYVVSEGARCAFINLQRFRGTGVGTSDRRHSVFISVLRHEANGIRFDIDRRDFATIEGSPLAYQRIGIIAHLFREHSPICPTFGETKIGHQTFDDKRFVRMWWEIEPRNVGTGKQWPPFAKGGDFSRFYSDVYLIVRWDKEAHRAYSQRKSNFNVLLTSSSSEYLNRPGLTWPRRTAKGFNIRWMPEGCIFGDKGPVFFPRHLSLTAPAAAILNSELAEFIMGSLTSFSWESGVLQRVPFPALSETQKDTLGGMAIAIRDAKASWDEGNETCTHFRVPWLLREAIINPKFTVPALLDRLAEFEASEETRIRKIYADLNEQIYKLYGIPDKTRNTIEETLGERPPEILWPQMEGKSSEQKRMEHVWRLLSYAVKRFVDADEDGIVPFEARAEKAALIDRVRDELAILFPDHDVNKIEVEIVNELKARVPGYRTVASIEQWIEDVYFEFHCSLYKNRPIIWHITSKQGRGPQAFGALCHYHKFDSNRMAKLRGTCLREAIQAFKREAALATQEGRPEDRQEWQAKLEEVQELDRKLRLVQEGSFEGKEGGDRDFRILTPWKSPEERPKGWNPDIDDGVTVNIAPLQRAGVLRKEKVV